MRALTIPGSVVAVTGLAALSLIVPPVSLLSAAALGLVTLRLGLQASARVLAFSLIGAGLLGMALGGSWLPTVVYGLLLWLPIWAAGLLLRRSADLALTLEAAGIVAVSALGLFYLLTDDAASFWQQVGERLIPSMLEHVPPGLDEAQMRKGLELASRYLSGVMIAGALIGLILELLLARWVQAIWFNPGGFHTEFLALRLHRPMASASLIVLAAGLAASGGLAEVAWNAFIPLSVLCLFGGISVIHALALGRSSFWLIGMYVALFLLPPATAPLFLLWILMGLSEPWLDWRRRLRGQSA